jgi:hypothetical protein
LKSINFPWNPPLLARHPFPLLLLTSLLATRVKTEKFTISKKQGSYFGNRILFILVHIYLDFLKTSYASNYFWDSEYFWDIFIRYFLNFFYGPPLIIHTRARLEVKKILKRKIQDTKVKLRKRFRKKKMHLVSQPQSPWPLIAVACVRKPGEEGGTKGAKKHMPVLSSACHCHL